MSDPISILLRLVVVLLLVLANGFFVAAEFSLVGVRRSRVAAMVAEGNKRARRLMRVIEHLDAYISATQLGITLASLALGWIGENTIAHVLKPVFAAIFGGPDSVIAAHSVAVGVAFALITFLHIVLGELAPKTLALERMERVALAVAQPMEIFYRVFKIPILLLNRSGGLVLKLMGLHSTTRHAASYGEEELRQLIALSHKSGHLIEDERRLIYNVFDFTDATLADVMAPRIDIEAVDATHSIEAILDRFDETGYSRMPVFRDKLDNIVGVLLLKDLSRAFREANGQSIESILRPAVFLPTSMRLNEALRSLRGSSTHLALVVDEHGGVEGLVTIEDLLEEIVGEIQDEHDEIISRRVVKQPNNSYIVSGKLSIKEANRLLRLDLPESDSYHTIAGFMMERAGRLLRRSESVVYNELKLTAESTARNRIVEVRIELLQSAAAEHAASTHSELHQVSSKKEI
jgi:CBS domain containing-hemolysin-like protein